jgi:DNA polymerase III epsilon subunit-like protein
MLPKDLLLVDLETSGLDPAVHDMIQIGAVLLDKKTLKEKKAFSSFVKPVNWKKRMEESMQINKIDYSQLKDAPNSLEVLNDLTELADPKKVILSYYVGTLDIDFLKATFKRNKQNFPFDYHFLNIWGIFLAYAYKHGLMTNKKQFAKFGLEDLIKHFKIDIPEESLHDALVDCRVEAEILRRIMFSL